MSLETLNKPMYKGFFTPTRIEPQFAIYGGLAAAVSAFTVQPLEVVKTRVIMSSNTNQYMQQRVLSTVINIFKNESVFAFWRGTGPSLLRVLPGAGLYFVTLENLTHFRKQAVNSNNLPALEYLLIGAFSRSLMTTLFLPLTIVKTRFESPTFQYRSTWDAFKNILKNEGYSGFSNGLLPTLMRDAPFSGIYYLLYSRSKIFVEEYNETNQLGINQYLIPAICGTYAGVVATALTHPPDVIRTKVQTVTLHEKKTTWQAIHQVLTESGITGFYKGLTLRLIRRPIMTAITWTCYEILKKVDG